MDGPDPQLFFYCFIIFHDDQTKNIKKPALYETTERVWCLVFDITGEEICPTYEITLVM
jgi:hypothetical protein